jgi:hypothetical protein
MIAIAQVVAVLHAHDPHNLACRLDLLRLHFRQSDVADLALGLQLVQLDDLVLQRELVVDAVQLEKVDGLHAEAPQAHFAFLAQVGGVAHRNPHVGTGAQESGLGRDDQPVVGMQRLADDLLGEVGPVGIGGVDEVHAEFHRSAQHPNGFVAVRRRPPDTLAGQAHGTVTEPVDGEITAESECSGCFGRR